MSPTKKTTKKVKKAVKKTTEKKMVTFSIEAAPESSVFVAGSFNEWNPDKNQLKKQKSGKFSARFSVPKGQHEFKYVIDGNWVTDESAEVVWNDQGSQNNLINVE